MHLTVIAAMEQKTKVIGRGNRIPWHIPEDLKRFKRTTTGHDIVMGRKTFESIGSKPLPNRRNVVISGTLEKVDGIEVFPSLSDALGTCTGKVFICGGAALYAEAIPLADEMILTSIEIPGFARLEGDVVFPGYGHDEWFTTSDVRFSAGHVCEYAVGWTAMKRIRGAK